MSLKNKKEIEKNVVELEIQVEADEFKDATDVAYKKMVKDIRVDGFRQGKAPKGIIEKKYGKEVFYEEAVNFIWSYAYESAVKEAGVSPVSEPELEIVGDITENGFAFKAKITVKPDITLKAYKGLKATKAKVTVSAKEVNEELEERRKKVGRQVVVDGPVANGDTAVIDFEGFIDDVAFPGGKGEEYPLEIGSGSFIPGFEEQLIGVEKGADKDVEVTFPENYHEESLKGKKAVFKCKVHEIKRAELPELDDEFAKDVSEFNTLDELKADIKEHIKGHKEADAEQQYEEELMKQIVDNIVGDIPEIMYENEVNYMVENFEDRLKTQGIDLETYLKYTDSTIEKLREGFDPQAKAQVKGRLALEYVAKTEGFTAEESEVDDEYKKIADSYQMPVQRIKAIIPADSIANDIKVKKAIDFIKGAAVEGKAPAKEEAKAESKPKAKTATKTAAKTAATKTAAKKTTESKPKTAAKKTSK